MRARRNACLLAALLLGATGTATAFGDDEPASVDGTATAGSIHDAPAVTPAPEAATSRNGREIYRRFREGLADPECEPGASARWRSHFAHAPRQLAAEDSEVLPLFGYVVDALLAAGLPTEYALIPFVESGYRPGARSKSGPAGLWQFIETTARNHDVQIRPGYDGRLSPVDATSAAVNYLRTLHGMLAGDWRLAVMAFNAGEYRVLGALRRSGQGPADADIDKLAMPDITRAYVRKLHALSCLLEEAEDREHWLDALDRPVPILATVPLSPGIDSLDALARRSGTDAALLKRLNPAFQNGIARAHRDRSILAPVGTRIQRTAQATTTTHNTRERGDTGMRTHTVARGESAWTIARRHRIPLDTLLALNSLNASSVLRPGMVLKLDSEP